ncbi:papain-like cysteine protease family protein [Longispora albida]|uniref:papain-like cysteine protease family protein n=1 Tax=Longispora albida TaxID=203523 RepID=UPI00035C2249|nr:papain-like cysteine protease family protein [Longispora albida]
MTRRQQWGRAAALAIALAAALAFPASPATAAPAAGPAAGQASATASQGLLASRRLNITQQVQQYSNWCWAATGNSIAAYYGYSYSQNQFCNLAFNRSMNSSCPNNQATLANDQEAFWEIGIAPGRYVTGWLYYSTVQTEINANRPIMTRIQWSSGGGHMMNIYGYDTASNWVYWSNPWGSSTRYNWGTHSYYVNNSSFSWTHSLYQIGM